MSSNSKAAPFKSASGPGAAQNIFRDYNDKSPIKQCLKAGVGLLVCHNLISFHLACWLSDLMQPAMKEKIFLRYEKKATRHLLRRHATRIIESGSINKEQSRQVDACTIVLDSLGGSYDRSY